MHVCVHTDMYALFGERDASGEPPWLIWLAHYHSTMTLVSTTYVFAVSSTPVHAGLLYTCMLKGFSATLSW